MKEKEIKVLRVKPHEHPEVYMLKKYIGSNARSSGRECWLCYSNIKDNLVKVIKDKFIYYCLFSLTYVNENN